MCDLRTVHMFRYAQPLSLRPAVQNKAHTFVLATKAIAYASLFPLQCVSPKRFICSVLGTVGLSPQVKSSVMSGANLVIEMQYLQ
jgi:hypothetical protein